MKVLSFVKRCLAVSFILLNASFSYSDTTVAGYNRQKVDIIDFKPTPLPAVSASGQGRIFYKNSDHKWYCSSNGAAYAECINATVATGAPTDATYITQTSNSTLSAEQALSSLSTGLLKVTTSTGVLSTASAGSDYQGVITGGATTILSSDLTVSKALISNSSGKVTVSPVTSTELGYVSGVSSAIQTQINAKGTGTVNTGTARAFTYYPASNTTVDDSAVAFTDGTNVGIGTSAPRTLMEVSGTVTLIHGGANGGSIGIGTTAPGASLAITATGSSATAFSIKVGTTTFALTNAGNLGIGNSAPSAPLEVTGNAKFTGNVGMGGGSPSTTISITTAASSSNSGTLKSMQNSMTNSNTGAASGVTGIDQTAIKSGSTGGNTLTLIAVKGLAEYSSTGTQTDAYGVYGDCQKITSATGIISDCYSVYGKAPAASGGGTITRAWGLGTDGNVYVGGNIGIGKTSPSVALDISGSATITGTLRSTRTTDFGWGVVAGANTACNTTCTNACIVGLDQGTLGAVLPSLVGCADATADQCLCAGST